MQNACFDRHIKTRKTVFGFLWRFEDTEPKPKENKYFNFKYFLELYCSPCNCNFSVISDKGRGNHPSFFETLSDPVLQGRNDFLKNSRENFD